MSWRFKWKVVQVDPIPSRHGVVRPLGSSRKGRHVSSRGAALVMLAH